MIPRIELYPSPVAYYAERAYLLRLGWPEEVCLEADEASHVLDPDNPKECPVARELPPMPGVFTLDITEKDLDALTAEDLKSLLT